MKLFITLKQSDSSGLGGELLETLGMERARRDPKTFVKELAVTELLQRFSNSFDDGEEEKDADEGELSAKAGAFSGRRRRRRRRMRPSDFLLYDDNSLYALPYLEPLTDRGIIPMRVSLRTDSTVTLTPINASVVQADPITDMGSKHRHSHALAALDEAIERAKKKGTFKSITADQKDKLMHEIADHFDESEAIDPAVVDKSLAKLKASSEDSELAYAALDLARRALMSDVADPSVVEAIRAAADVLDG